MTRSYMIAGFYCRHSLTHCRYWSKIFSIALSAASIGILPIL